MKKVRQAGLALCVFFLTGIAQADRDRDRDRDRGRIEVLSAFYGKGGRIADVRFRVQALADRGYNSFSVNDEALGCDPARGERKTLEVVYLSGGQRFTDAAKDDGVFEFRRGGGWDSWSPWYQGKWPGGEYGGVDFQNQCGDRVFVYHVNSHGRWEFVREVHDGQGFSSRCPAGETWIVTDPKNRILRQVRAGRGEEAVVIGRDRWNDRPMGGKVEIRFVNRTRHEVRVHRVDRNGGWDKAAEIREGDAEVREFQPGEPWIVTDGRKRLIASGRAGRQSDKVEIRE